MPGAERGQAGTELGRTLRWRAGSLCRTRLPVLSTRDVANANHYSLGKGASPSPGGWLGPRLLDPSLPYSCQGLRLMPEPQGSGHRTPSSSTGRAGRVLQCRGVSKGGPPPPWGLGTSLQAGDRSRAPWHRHSKVLRLNSSEQPVGMSPRHLLDRPWRPRRAQPHTQMQGAPRSSCWHPELGGTQDRLVAGVPSALQSGLEAQQGSVGHSERASGSRPGPATSPQREPQGSHPHPAVQHLTGGHSAVALL